MRLDDARRLTGPNLYGPRPLVLAEFVLDAGEDPESARALYAEELVRLRSAVGLSPVAVRTVRASVRWAAFAFEAPLDEMLVGAEAADWAGLSAGERSAGRPACTLEPKRSELVAMWARDRNPRLPALEAEAARRGVPFLWDDELVSVGHGNTAVSWPRHALPTVDQVPWPTLRRMPIALVTGTNGKTTSTRLLARMVKESGRKVGFACSDSVTIREQTIQEGDWTGPAAARLVLRSPEVEVAVLETARGGILRRGLACDVADVALLTNITDDHLGSYGVEDLDGMLAAKAVIAKVVHREGTVVLNARDARLRALQVEARRVFFFDEDGQQAPLPAGAGSGSVVARKGVLLVVEGGSTRPLVRIEDIPISFKGSARYNVENALGATAAALALGVPDDAIIRALKNFRGEDNPGRGETWLRDGRTMFIDFAHNPDGVAQALGAANSLRGAGGRLFVISGSPGDRSDAELEAVAERVRLAEPSAVYLRELADYLRGREPGEVPGLLRKALVGTTLTDAQVVTVASEVEAVERALGEARAGDVIALLVHVDRDEVKALLEASGWTRG